MGCGGQGRGDLKNASRFGRVVALCDVDAGHLAAAAKDWPKAVHVHDFRKIMERKDVDIVICGTVDHWHTLVSVAAMRAGKDVYCEKPLTLTIDEGKRLVEVQKKTGAFCIPAANRGATGISAWPASWFAMAGSARSRKSMYGCRPGVREGPFKKAPVPKNFDWDFWQGPTPVVDYVPEARMSRSATGGHIPVEL